MAYHVIHVTPDLSPTDYRRAVGFGPTEVGSRHPMSLVEAAGFAGVVQIDLTEEFLRICRVLVDVTQRYSARLRQEQGEAVFEEEQAKRRRYIEGIEAGLLCRSLLVATKPARRGDRG